MRKDEQHKKEMEERALRRAERSARQQARGGTSRILPERDARNKVQERLAEEKRERRRNRRLNTQ